MNLLVFSNKYGLFGDEKASGIEIIHHGVRTATNGDIRLSPTPEQWDSIPKFIKRNINKQLNTIEALLEYPHYNFAYTITTKAKQNGIEISVNLDKPLPAALQGRAGFNLEFVPAAFFGKSYIANQVQGIFPLYPASNMQQLFNTNQPLPLATANSFVLAPDDAEKQIAIESNTTISLYDGRNKAQNGWFVLRSLIPSNKTGNVLQWFITGNTIANWVRQPVIAHSQVGYHPLQNKIAIIELDKNDKPLAEAQLIKINSNGLQTIVHKAPLKKWGNYLRYHYYQFNFSTIKNDGIYILQYGNVKTKPFKIANDVYAGAWHPTLDVFFNVQMDHMFVNEAYRVWHGRSHMDDALQAPINTEHFDLYKQGPVTGTKYAPGQHIPGLNVGGWYDAGDFDIRTQTVYSTVVNLVNTWELFKPLRDQTSINQQTKYADLHMPDGKPDILQQIEHGTLFLLSHFKSVGHALNGVVEAHLDQYTHLGDAVTKTDNLVYNAALKQNETDGFTSGNFDDRWAFTNKSSALNYGSIGAMAAASRVLKNYNDTLATECINTAITIWNQEQTHAPDIFRHGNTTGGNLQDEKLRAALELLIATSDKKFADTILAALPDFEKNFGRFATLAVKAMPYMDAAYKNKIEKLVFAYKNNLEKFEQQNPFGVPIGTGGWAGSGGVIGFAINNYLLHKAFPTIIDKEFVFKGLNYIYGTHPGSDVSLVSAVGTHSKEIAYGNNRADFSFIAGGIVPGILILPPDYPENKEDWPFIWGENEYVVNLGASYIFLVHAVQDLLELK
jgi:endoglucanase